jgi:hypothetical protein
MNWKTVILVSLFLLMAMIAAIFFWFRPHNLTLPTRPMLVRQIDARPRGSTVEHDFPHVVSSNSVTVTMIPYGEVPEWMAAIVQTHDPMEAWQNNQQAAI